MSGFFSSFNSVASGEICRLDSAAVFVITLPTADGGTTSGVSNSAFKHEHELTTAAILTGLSEVFRKTKIWSKEVPSCTFPAWYLYSSETSTAPESGETPCLDVVGPCLLKPHPLARIVVTKTAATAMRKERWRRHLHPMTMTNRRSARMMTQIPTETITARAAARHGDR